MRNPLRTEAAAFRLAAATAVAGGAVAVASTLGTAAAIGAWAVATLLAIALSLRGAGRARPLRTAPPHRGGPDERRLVLVAGRPPAAEALRGLAGRASSVVVVAPAYAAPLRRWVSDLDGARRHALARAEAAVSVLEGVDVPVEGIVGDGDPVLAVEDALRRFGGDEIVVSGGDALAARLRGRFALPVTQLAA